MIEVSVTSIKISLLSQQRVVLLKDESNERYLPIWIGAFEAESIRIALAGIKPPRPLTHDLLKDAISTAGYSVERVTINKLENEVFHAQILLAAGTNKFELDSRPSDAIALAVRVESPIFIEEEVLENASIKISPPLIKKISSDLPVDEETNTSDLESFSDFLNTLDMDDFGQN